MAYNVRLGNKNHRVAQRPSPQYSLDVNYEIPSKSTQFTNLKLDNITSQFDGVEDTFGLSIDGTAYYPLNDEQLMISLDDVILDPGTDYTISDDKIIFSTVPLGSNVFFGVAYATTADLTRTLNYVIDSGSVPLFPGIATLRFGHVGHVFRGWGICSQGSLSGSTMVLVFWGGFCSYYCSVHSLS